MTWSLGLFLLGIYSVRKVWTNLRDLKIVAEEQEKYEFENRGAGGVVGYKDYETYKNLTSRVRSRAVWAELRVWFFGFVATISFLLCSLII